MKECKISDGKLFTQIATKLFVNIHEFLNLKNKIIILKTE